MSKKLKRKCTIAAFSWPLTLMILAPGWWKLIGIAELIYIVVTAACTYIDERRSEDETI